MGSKQQFSQSWKRTGGASVIGTYRSQRGPPVTLTQPEAFILIHRLLFNNINPDLSAQYSVGCTSLTSPFVHSLVNKKGDDVYQSNLHLTCCKGNFPLLAADGSNVSRISLAQSRPFNQELSLFFCLNIEGPEVSLELVGPSGKPKLCTLFKTHAQSTRPGWFPWDRCV